MAAFVAKAEELGFAYIEANAWLSPGMLAQLLATGVPISSIHAPCPNVLSSTGNPAGALSLSSLDASERSEAVSFTRQAIDLAADVKARAVVLHMGEAPIDPRLEDRLRRLHREGQARTAEYDRAATELVRRRNALVLPYLEAAGESLRELSKHSRQKGIILGIETRFHLHEIPNIDEAAQLLEEVPEDAAGYWHDVGHAEVQQRLGLNAHEEWLSRFQHRMVGIHLHDIVGICDHHAPGAGDIDWSMIAGYIPAGIVKVCEIGEWNEEEQVQGVVGFLHEAGIV